ncbi:hypothetical protein [Streptomyces sp. KL116D]|uniref:hypothetical protein n=1 Tax=Streptomyces sp. KL116D TaxID=3045152 RepID=UPI0035591C7E
MRIGRYADEADAPSWDALHDQADHETRTTGDGRAASSRAPTAPSPISTRAALRRPALEHFAALADGGRVPLAEPYSRTDRA